MKKAAALSTTQSPDGKDHFGLGTVALDLLDTTWRIAVPVVVLAGVGIFADVKLETKPWLTLLGMMLGFAVAGVLLKKQLAAVEKRDKK